MELSADANHVKNPRDLQRPVVWSQVDWRQVERNVLRLQHRIFMAKAQGDTQRVASLQRLLASSWSAKLLAVRQVGQQNDGRKTPGIDGVTSTTDRDRERLLEDGLCLLARLWQVEFDALVELHLPPWSTWSKQAGRSQQSTVMPGYLPR